MQLPVLDCQIVGTHKRDKQKLWSH